MHAYTTHSQRPKRVISVYAAAGFATSPQFMSHFLDRIEQELGREGMVLRAELLFPYGDWHLNKMRQLREIASDLRLSIKKRHFSVGGRRILSTLHKEDRITGDELILIGHSAGGLAAMHAAHRLMELNDRDGASSTIPNVKVIQIGSPRCRVPKKLQRSSLYVYATNAKGRVTDPITKMGSWSGWPIVTHRKLLRDPLFYAPDSIQGVQTIGGHKDYFRHMPPFVNEAGCTNLDVTVQAIMNWLKL
ncbi:hypothetical protein MALU111345_20530 [Marinicrinis lubricantis]